MLTVSHCVLYAFANESAKNEREAFYRWIASLRNIIGPFSPVQTNEAFSNFLDEANQAGIESDQRLFEYVASRMLMPEMDGIQYFKVLDVIFSDEIGDARIAQLVRICAKHNG